MGSYCNGFAGTIEAVFAAADDKTKQWLERASLERWAEADELVAYVSEALVPSAYRGRGIGTRMVRALLDQLEGLGVSTVHLEALPASIRFWSGLGFEIVEDHGLNPHMFRSI